jgi:hypothetical protein
LLALKIAHSAGGRAALSQARRPAPQFAASDEATNAGKAQCCGGNGDWKEDDFRHEGTRLEEAVAALQLGARFVENSEL